MTHRGVDYSSFSTMHLLFYCRIAFQILVCSDNIAHVPVDSKVITMATSIHPSIPVLSPSFLYHPHIPSFKSIHLLVSFLFFGCTLHINTLRNILPEAICCCLPTSYFYLVLLELCYACSLLQLLIWPSYFY